MVVRLNRGCVISAFDELRGRGSLGAECLALIFRLLREEVRRFPVLSPKGGWQPADLEDLLQDFLVDRLQPVTASLLTQASDDQSMGRLLRKSIRYWLVDQARETGVGSLRRVLKKVLSEGVDFEQVPTGEDGAGRWRLTGTVGPPWSGRVEELVEAARAVPNVKIPKWSSSTRRPPVADRASLVAIARAVLTAASASLEIAQIVEVFVARFPAALDPAVVPLLDDQDVGTVRDRGLTPEEEVVAAAVEVGAAVGAAAIVGMLSPQERHLVPHLEEPQEIQRLLACGRSQAYHHARRLKDKLRQLLGDSDEARAVGLEVIELCGGSTEK